MAVGRGRLSGQDDLQACEQAVRDPRLAAQGRILQHHHAPLRLGCGHQLTGLEQVGPDVRVSPPVRHGLWLGGRRDQRRQHLPQWGEIAGARPLIEVDARVGLGDGDADRLRPGPALDLAHGVVPSMPVLCTAECGRRLPDDTPISLCSAVRSLRRSGLLAERLSTPDARKSTRDNIH